MLGSDVDARVAKPFDFVIEVFYIDNHTVTHDVDGFVAKYSRRKKVKYELALFVYYRVSGVVSALITRDNIVPVRKKVNHSSLAFVAPVDTDYCSKHLCISP